MSTRRPHGPYAAEDPLEAVARVACAQRERLLRVNRRRLPYEDLEDCYGQATLELLVRARQGCCFSSDAHLANALDQRLGRRIEDRRRAFAGRSPIEAATRRSPRLTDDGAEVERLADPRGDMHELVCLRERLRRASRGLRSLTQDQRLVLISQLEGELDRAAFCRRHRWSGEKYRKVAQRARAGLRAYDR